MTREEQIEKLQEEIDREKTTLVKISGKPMTIVGHKNLTKRFIAYEFNEAKRQSVGRNIPAIVIIEVTDK